MTTIHAKGTTLHIPVIRRFYTAQMTEGINLTPTETRGCFGKEWCHHEPRKSWRTLRRYIVWKFMRPAHLYEVDLPFSDTIIVKRPQSSVEVNGETIEIVWE